MMIPVQGCGSWCLLSSLELERNTWVQAQLEKGSCGTGASATADS